MKNKKQYNGWLVSDSILERSMAVWGHSMLATIIIDGVLLSVVFIVSLLIG